MSFDLEKMEEAGRLMLEALGDDPNRDGLKDTPKRMAKMYSEILSGYDQRPDDFITQFDNDEGYVGPVILRKAPFYTYCEHHWQLFAGELNIAYQPKDKVVGLSKLIRVSRVYAKRLQVQERLTKQISDALQRLLEPEWIVTKIEAEHYCMSIRGTRTPGTTTTTIYGHGNYPTNIFSV